MPGTTENPVRFANPFRRITEVGWPAAFLVMQTSLGGTTSGAVGGGSCPVFETPPGPAWDNYMTLWSLTLNTPDVIKHLPGSEEGVTGEADVSGIPTPSSPSFGAWEKVRGTGSIAGYSVAGVKGRWTAIGGSLIQLPNYPALDNQFKNVTSAGFEGIGDVYNGDGPYCSFGPIGSHYLGYGCTGVVTGEPLHGNAETYGGQTLDFSGTTIAYGSGTYVPIGLKVTQALGTPNPSVGTIAVLFQRQTG